MQDKIKVKRAYTRDNYFQNQIEKQLVLLRMICRKGRLI